jgi:hypothetical protein
MTRTIDRARLRQGQCLDTALRLPGEITYLLEFLAANPASFASSMTDNVRSRSTDGDQA